MEDYNWQRPHQYNEGWSPAEAEEKLNLLSGNGCPLHTSPER